ncbi:MAG: glycosyltransferase family 2 protein [bacterium]
MDPETISPEPFLTIKRTKISADAINPFVSFAMPAYNEESNIERTVGECVKAFDESGISNDPGNPGNSGWGEIVVTNDCSKDSTGAILEKLQGQHRNLTIVTHVERNLGYGRALGDAIRASRGSWVATIDSDGQFDPTNLGEMILKIRDDIDCVAGYRMKKKDSPLRVIADRGLNFIVRTLFGISHRDTNCAFKLVRGNIIRNLNIETNGFQTPSEIVLKLHAMGKNMVECGVIHRERGEGKSKLKVIKTSIDFLRFLFYLKNKIGLYKARILSKL